VATLAAVAVLAVAGSADAAVRKVSFTGSGAANSYASLKVKVSHKSRCTFKVVYDTTVSQPPGVRCGADYPAPGGDRRARLRPKSFRISPSRWTAGSPASSCLRLHVR
jgi:hypothetical protein